LSALSLAEDRPTIVSYIFIWEHGVVTLIDYYFHVKILSDLRYDCSFSWRLHPSLFPLNHGFFGANLA